MAHYDPLAHIQSSDDYEDYDGFFYYNDRTYLHVRATFVIVENRRASAYVTFMLKSEHGNELWPRAVDIDSVPVATLEGILAATGSLATGEVA